MPRRLNEPPDTPSTTEIALVAFVIAAAFGLILGAAFLGWRYP